MQNSNYLKHFLFISLIITTILLLSACSAETATENEIQNEISIFENFTESNMSINSYSETKRQTDTKNKSDIIWVSIIAQNENAEYRASYILEYTQYNSGWILDNIVREKSSFNALDFVEGEVIKNDIMEMYGAFIDTYNLTNINIEAPVISQSDLSDALGAPFVFYSINCSAENDDAYFNASFIISYEMNLYSGWEIKNAEMIDYSYNAKEAPSDSVVSAELLRRNGTCTLISENKIYDNMYVYYYSELDDISCNDLTITWSDTFTFVFNPDFGWFVSDSQFEIENIATDFVGNWQYKEGDEYFDLTVQNSSNKDISLELDLLFKETHIWGNEQTCELSSDGETITREWTYTYDPDSLCLIFMTTKRLFNIEWCGGLSEKDYYLEYRAYINEQNGTSGFYVDGRLLTKIF